MSKMHDIHVNTYIDAPPDKVFADVSDHVVMLSGGRINQTRILTQGAPDRNGLGCVREVRGLGLWLHEEVTLFEPPHRYDYLIIKSNAPMAHEGGSIRLTPRGDGTEVNWTTRFGVPVPLLGGALGELSKWLLLEEFTRMLLASKKRLER